MKEQLRYKYKIKRKYFQHSAREVADGAIADCFFALFVKETRFFIYNSFGSEADTHAIVDELIKRGKQVYLPRVEGEEIVPVRYDGDRQSLKEGAFKILEPAGQAYGGGFDAIIVPLLAINSRGYRLGYGGGFYDRFLKDKQCLKVGLGYYLQLTDEFIEDGWDVPLDYFICEKGVYDFGWKSDKNG